MQLLKVIDFSEWCFFGQILWESDSRNFHKMLKLRGLALYAWVFPLKLQIFVDKCPIIFYTFYKLKKLFSFKFEV